MSQDKLAQDRVYHSLSNLNNWVEVAVIKSIHLHVASFSLFNSRKEIVYVSVALSFGLIAIQKPLTFIFFLVLGLSLSVFADILPYQGYIQYYL